MIQDDLLKLTEDEWDNLSDAELHKRLEPYFKVTKPEQALLFADTGERKKVKSNYTERRVKTSDTLAEIQMLMARVNNVTPKPPPIT